MEIYHTLLDEGRYLCHARTMVRILAAEGEVRERRNQLRHPRYQKPELLATAPNQVWSWEFTRLRGPEKWTYYYLYVVLDIFSRYVVGWMLADCESDVLGRNLVHASCEKQQIEPATLKLHGDRGPVIASKTVAQLCADLNITRSHSRPHVSNNNPYSESQFKTLKYNPWFPERFGCKQDSVRFSRSFFSWYNCQHRHCGIAMMTPEIVHYGQAPTILANRSRVLDAAYLNHPERFVNKRPKPQRLPEAVWINPPVPRQEPVIVLH